MRKKYLIDKTIRTLCACFSFLHCLSCYTVTILQEKKNNSRKIGKIRFSGSNTNDEQQQTERGLNAKSCSIFSQAIRILIRS